MQTVLIDINNKKKMVQHKKGERVETYIEKLTEFQREREREVGE